MMLEKENQLKILQSDEPTSIQEIDETENLCPSLKENDTNQSINIDKNEISMTKDYVTSILKNDSLSQTETNKIEKLLNETLVKHKVKRQQKPLQLMRRPKSWVANKSSFLKYKFPSFKKKQLDEISSTNTVEEEEYPKMKVEWNNEEQNPYVTKFSPDIEKDFNTKHIVSTSVLQKLKHSIVNPFDTIFAKQQSKTPIKKRIDTRKKSRLNWVSAAFKQRALLLLHHKNKMKESNYNLPISFLADCKASFGWQKIVSKKKPLIDTTNITEDEIWNNVSLNQLKVLYATIQASSALEAEDKAAWLTEVHKTLADHSDRCDVSDKLRAAALDGNAIATCLDLLKNSFLVPTVTNATEDDSKNAIKHFNVATMECVYASIKLLQELCLNDVGVALFWYYSGPSNVMACIKQMRLIDNNGLPSRNPEELELDTLKATYRLVLASSSCDSSYDCTHQWFMHNITDFPLATLGSSFLNNCKIECYQDANYVSLALGVLRILCSRQQIETSDAIHYSEVAFQQLSQYSNNPWVCENALGILAATSELHEDVTFKLCSIANVWVRIIACCHNLKNDGHVLYQGLRVLKFSCLANRELAKQFIELGAEKLIEEVSEPRNNKSTYSEQLWLTAIQLKHLLRPFDFETNEVQKYLRTATFEMSTNNFLNGMLTSSSNNEDINNKEEPYDIDEKILEKPLDEIEPVKVELFTKEELENHADGSEEYLQKLDSENDGCTYYETEQQHSKDNDG